MANINQPYESFELRLGSLEEIQAVVNFLADRRTNGPVVSFSDEPITPDSVPMTREQQCQLFASWFAVSPFVSDVPEYRHDFATSVLGRNVTTWASKHWRREDGLSLADAEQLQLALDHVKMFYDAT